VKPFLIEFDDLKGLFQPKQFYDSFFIRAAGGYSTSYRLGYLFL